MKTTVAIDIGTGSTRAALMGDQGQILFVAAREYQQITPAFGWSEQRPEDWWAAACATLREVNKRYPNASKAVKTKVTSEQSRLSC